MGHDWNRLCEGSVTTISGIGCPLDGLLQPQLQHGRVAMRAGTDPVFAGFVDLFLLKLLPPARSGTIGLNLQTRCLLPGTSLTWGNGYSTLASYFRFRLGLGQMGGVSRPEGVYKKPENLHGWLETQFFFNWEIHLQIGELSNVHSEWAIEHLRIKSDLVSFES